MLLAVSLFCLDLTWKTDASFEILSFDNSGYFYDLFVCLELGQKLINILHVLTHWGLVILFIINSGISFKPIGTKPLPESMISSKAPSATSLNEIWINNWIFSPGIDELILVICHNCLPKQCTVFSSEKPACLTYTFGVNAFPHMSIGLCRGDVIPVCTLKICHNIREPGQYQPDAASIGLILAWFWHILHVNRVNNWTMSLFVLIHRWHLLFN